MDTPKIEQLTEDNERKKVAREERRSKLREELAKGKSVKPSEILKGLSTQQFDQDVEEIQNSLESVRGLIASAVGPVPLQLKGTTDPRQVRLPWAPLARIISAPEYEGKRAVAKCLLTAKDGLDWVLPRERNVLLAPPGSATILVVALVLAECLAEQIEKGKKPDFAPIIGDWHTDMVLAALLLGRLPRASHGPRIFLNDCDMSPLAGTNDETAPWAVSISATPRERIDPPSTLVLGCNYVDENGDIYTRKENYEKVMQRYLDRIEDKPENRVIIVAAKEKLGSMRNGHRIRYSRNSRDFVIVTDDDPRPVSEHSLKSVPHPFRAIFWPHGAMKRQHHEDIQQLEVSANNVGG